MVKANKNRLGITSVMGFVNAPETFSKGAKRRILRVLVDAAAWSTLCQHGAQINLSYAGAHTLQTDAEVRDSRQARREARGARESSSSSSGHEDPPPRDEGGSIERSPSKEQTTNSNNAVAKNKSSAEREKTPEKEPPLTDGDQTPAAETGGDRTESPLVSPPLTEEQADELLGTPSNGSDNMDIQ